MPCANNKVNVLKRNRRAHRATHPRWTVGPYIFSRTCTHEILEVCPAISTIAMILDFVCEVMLAHNVKKLLFSTRDDAL
jgi:hypothetical protein